MLNKDGERVYTEAEKRANAEYYKRNKGRRVSIGVSYTAEEAEHIKATLKEHNTSAGEVLREVVKRLDEKGEY